MFVTRVLILRSLTDSAGLTRYLSRMDVLISSYCFWERKMALSLVIIAFKGAVTLPICSLITYVFGKLHVTWSANAI